MSNGSESAQWISRPGVSPSRSNRADLAVWLAVLLPFLVLAGLRVGFEWFPVQDHAVLDMRVRDTLAGSDLPLVGAFSRFSWSHPGPVWFYSLAPFRWLAGDSAGLISGSLVLFGGGIATFVAMARRRFGNMVAASAAFSMLLALAAAGPFTVMIPWNPHLAFAWFPLFLLLCVSAVWKRPSDLAAASFWGGLLVQLHVGYAVAVLITLGSACLVLGFGHRHNLWGAINQFLHLRASKLWLALLAASWVPPVVEQIANGREGNAGRILWFFVNRPDNAGEVSGIKFSAAMLGGVVRFPFAGLGGSGEVAEEFTVNLLPGSPWLFVVPLVSILVAGGMSWFRKDKKLFGVCVVVGSALVAGVIAVSRLIGDRWSYIFVWRFSLIWFVIAASWIAVALLTYFRNRPAAVPASGHGGRRTTAILVLAICGLDASVLIASAPAYADNILPFEANASALASQLESMDPPAQPVLILRFGDILQGVADGVLNTFDAEGWELRVPPNQAYKYGSDRAYEPSGLGEVWLVAESSLYTSLSIAIPRSDVLAMTTPLTPREDLELQDLHLQLAKLLYLDYQDPIPVVTSSLAAIVMGNEMIDVGNIDVDRLAELNAKVENSEECRCAVVSIPTDGPRSPTEVLDSLVAQ